MKKLNVLFVILFYWITLFSQVNMSWYKTYHGSGNWSDRGNSVLIKPDGNIYVTGFSFDSRIRAEYTTIEYSSFGNQTWIRTIWFNQNSNSYGVSILNDKRWNIFVTGYSSDPSGNYPSSIDFIPYDTGGGYSTAYHYSGYIGGYSCIDSTGYIYTTGYKYNSNYLDSSNLVLIKYYYNGNTVWINTFRSNPNKFEDPSAIGVDTASNIYITGFCINQNGFDDIFLLKYDKNSNFKWIRYFNGAGNGHDRPWGMAIKQNYIYVTGYTQSVNNGYDMVLLKYDSSGNLVWSRTFDGISHWTDIASDVCVDNSNNIYITGYSTNLYPRFTTVKYNSGGIFVWAKTFDNYPGGAMKICLDKDQNIYATGNASLPDTNNGLLTIKYDTSGNILWYQLLSTQNHLDAESYAVAVDENYNVVITGGWNNMFTTVKYNQLIGIRKISIDLPKSFSLYQNYPNPFNPTTKIEFSIPATPLSIGNGEGPDLPAEASAEAGMRNIKLIIYDILGREVATLVNEKLNPGTYEVEWNASNFSSGVYFYKLTTQSFSQTKKLVLLK